MKGCLVVLILLAIVALMLFRLMYLTYYAPPSIERVEMLFDISFEGVFVKVVGGKETYDPDNDTVVSATLSNEKNFTDRVFREHNTSQTTSEHFIGRIEEKYPLSKPDNDGFQSYSYDDGQRIKSLKKSIRCHRKKNICHLEYSHCC
ncbi:MAG: hypothetical protein AAF512_19835 [Pseudomonadota bacterium]